MQNYDYKMNPSLESALICFYPQMKDFGFDLTLNLQSNLTLQVGQICEPNNLWFWTTHVQNLPKVPNRKEAFQISSKGFYLHSLGSWDLGRDGLQICRPKSLVPDLLSVRV